MVFQVRDDILSILKRNVAGDESNRRRRQRLSQVAWQRRNMLFSDDHDDVEAEQVPVWEVTQGRKLNMKELTSGPTFTERNVYVLKYVHTIPIGTSFRRCRVAFLYRIQFSRVLKKSYRCQLIYRLL